MNDSSYSEYRLDNGLLVAIQRTPTKTFSGALTGYQGGLQEKINEEYQKLEAEVKKEKEKKFKELDNNIYKVVQDVSKKVIGRAISVSEQEDLVIDALNNAKKEGAI